jgi:hypothetical protein
MTKKTKRLRGSNDPALSAFKALQHVIEQTEGNRKKPAKKKRRT